MPQRKFVPKKKESKWKTRARRARTALKTSAQIATDVAKLSASVAYLGSRLNAEKKYKDRDIINGHFGQVNANANGIYMIDVTPQVSQGTDSDERIGNSLKLTGLSMPIQFDSQSKTISARKIRVMLFSVRAADNGVNATECINDYFDVNPINGIIDMNSPERIASILTMGLSSFVLRLILFQSQLFCLAMMTRSMMKRNPRLWLSSMSS